jgi:hypothetical protein
MPDLHNKAILILSPQNWGTMFLSKHHYAIELAKKGNKVYFLNPPAQDKPFNLKPQVTIAPSGVVEDLYMVSHRFGFPYMLKFHAKPVYNLLVRFHIKRLLRSIGGTPDIIWSFDLGDLYPFRLFGDSGFRIFHPVDEPLNKTAIDSAAGADVIFSVTNEILEKYADYGIPRYFINHGLSSEFVRLPSLEKDGRAPIRAGFAGNLLRDDIDREIMLRIIRENPDVVFECWGSYTGKQSNIGGSVNSLTDAFVESLKKCGNVVLHGAIPTAALANEMQRIDVFLICYDVKKDQSRGTNYHKIIEFLSTGKVIVSNNVTTYNNRPALVQMVKERDNNEALPALFKEVVGHLDDHNRPSCQEERRAFARDNTYETQIERIEKIIDGQQA